MLVLAIAIAGAGLHVHGQVGVLPKKNVTLKESRDDKFRAGDVWEYQTRKGEEHSRATILRIEESPELGRIVHVRVDNVRFHNCQGGPEPDSVEHMPFARKAFEESVAKKVASDQPLPDYKEAYQEWRRPYEQKRAGTYVISVADAVSVAEKTFQKGIGCEQAQSQ